MPRTMPEIEVAVEPAPTLTLSSHGLLSHGPRQIPQHAFGNLQSTEHELNEHVFAKMDMRALLASTSADSPFPTMARRPVPKYRYFCLLPTQIMALANAFGSLESLD